jgi:superfamily II DNA/RNA helicase
MSKGFQKFQLDERVNEALSKIGFKRPTAVQEEVMPLILQKRNVVVEAATGTGKTAAYGLPLLSRIDVNKRSTQVLVLAPSRELALQVETALRSFTTHPKFRVASIYGGMSLVESEKKVKSSPHILVAVPGRLKDVLRGGKLDHLWRDIKFLVIDEADKLLEFGFQEILDNIVSHVRNMVQVALFSATINEDVEALIKERFHPVQVVRLQPQEALQNITFHYIVATDGQKQRYLAALIPQQKIKQALIFTPNRDEVYDLANFLRALGYKAEAYHGLLDQVERAAVMKRFKKKQVHFLVATDLAARGLDVELLPAVINYAFPEELEIYLHRCGRTGRAGKKGSVYNLVASKKEEILVQSFHSDLNIAITGYMMEPMPKEALKSHEARIVKVHLNRGKRDKVSAGDIVGFLTHTVSVDANQIGTIAVYDAYTLVDLPEWTLEMLESTDDPKLKGKTVRVTKYSLEDQKQRAEAVKKSQIGVRDRAKLAETVEDRPRKSKAAAVPAESGKKGKGAKVEDGEKAAIVPKKFVRKKEKVSTAPKREKSSASSKREKPASSSKREKGGKAEAPKGKVKQKSNYPKRTRL